MALPLIACASIGKRVRMTSAGQLRRMIAADPDTAHLARKPIDHAIAEIRRLRKNDADFDRLNNRQHDREDD